ncbi:hypothetical protein V8G54_007591 [Vigna mungo]|uniref:SEC63 domain-containing protein n=1 Tax=Vigna mungo TaxID=3915 RepID=A0AAQ3S987_VIGMU
MLPPTFESKEQRKGEASGDFQEFDLGGKTNTKGKLAMDAALERKTQAHTSEVENYNETLSEKVKYPVDKNRLDDPHIKANLLFQAHFSQLELPISDYVTDLKSVLDQSIRIIQAMIDICANSGWLSSSITCMRLLQMIMQGLWFGKDSSLWMLPCMNTDLISSLSQRGISSVQELLDIPKTALQTVTANFPASRLYQDLQHFPHIKVKLKIQRRDTDGEKSDILNIRLEKINSRRHSSRAFVPRFPKIKEEQWWLVLANTSTSELYALKRVSFSDHLNTSMKLPLTPANLQVNDFYPSNLWFSFSSCSSYTHYTNNMNSVQNFQETQYLPYMSTGWK